METPSHDFSACVKALSGAFVLSRRALQSELAVSLYVYHTLGGTSLDARRGLRQVYADAGRPCLNHEDEAYQTVQRRIARSAALYQKLGTRRVAKAVGRLVPAAAIRALVDMLEPLALFTMDQVGAYAGHFAAPEQRQQLAPVGVSLAGTPEPDDVEVVHVRTKHLDVAIPPSVDARELMRLANKLIQMAQEMGE